MSKKDKLKNLIERIHKGENEENIKIEFKQEFGNITSSEIANIEQELIKDGIDPSQIQKLCNVHADVFSGNIEDIHSLDEIDKSFGHPLFVFRKENEGLLNFLDKEFIPKLDAFKIENSSDNKNKLLESIKILKSIEKHYQRKENLFFPYLEKNGITGPPQVMWGKDDEVRDLIRELLNDNYSDERFLLKVNTLLDEVKSMVKKENEILSPLLLKNLDRNDFLEVSKSSLEMQFSFNKDIEGANLSDINEWIKNNSNKILKDNILIQNKDSKENKIEDGIITLPTGKIKLRDLNYMLNTHPQDMTFIDKDDKVVYFSQGKHPVFPRTKTIIGRDVRNCHPPRSVPVVDFLINTFKEGLQDKEERMVKKGDKILLIRYYAVRDEENNYVGTLEVTEEISEIVKRANLLK